jgi:hypothetical protein
MRFVHLPPARGSGVMQGRTGLFAALAMPPTIGSRFEVRGSPNRRPHGYHILATKQMRNRSSGTPRSTFRTHRSCVVHRQCPLEQRYSAYGRAGRPTRGNFYSGVSTSNYPLRFNWWYNPPCVSGNVGNTKFFNSSFK